jgi:hypothetical protein
MCRFTFLLITSIILTACGSAEQQFENLPIEIESKSQVVQIEQVIRAAQKEVQRTLPDAYLVFFSFVGECSALPNLQGELRLEFAELQWSLFGNRTIFADTTVDTINQTLRYSTKDETEHYMDMEPLVMDGKGVQEIAGILHDYLVSKNNCSDTVVLSRVRTESPWLVRCGPPNEVFLECIKIDPETGKVTEL